MATSFDTSPPGGGDAVRAIQEASEEFFRLCPHGLRETCVVMLERVWRRLRANFPDVAVEEGGSCWVLSPMLGRISVYIAPTHQHAKAIAYSLLGEGKFAIVVDDGDRVGSVTSVTPAASG